MGFGPTHPKEKTMTSFDYFFLSFLVAFALPVLLGLSTNNNQRKTN